MKPSCADAEVVDPLRPGRPPLVVQKMAVAAQTKAVAVAQSDVEVVDPLRRLTILLSPLRCAELPRDAQQEAWAPPSADEEALLPPPQLRNRECGWTGPRPVAAEEQSGVGSVRARAIVQLVGHPRLAQRRLLLLEQAPR